MAYPTDMWKMDTWQRKTTKNFVKDVIISKWQL